jgi:hypothetical protein
MPASSIYEWYRHSWVKMIDRLWLLMWYNHDEDDDTDDDDTDDYHDDGGDKDYIAMMVMIGWRWMDNYSFSGNISSAYIKIHIHWFCMSNM